MWCEEKEGMREREKETERIQEEGGWKGGGAGGRMQGRVGGREGGRAAGTRQKCAKTGLSPSPSVFPHPMCYRGRFQNYIPRGLASALQIFIYPHRTPAVACHYGATLAFRLVSPGIHGCPGGTERPGCCER